MMDSLAEASKGAAMLAGPHSKDVCALEKVTQHGT